MNRRKLLTTSALLGLAVRSPGPAMARQPRPEGPARAPYCDLRTPRAVAATRQSLRPAPFDVVLPRPAQLDGRTALEVPLVPAEVELLPGTRTPMLTYDGVFPGPTIRATLGVPSTVAFTNTLTDPAVVHLHGSHVPAPHDGHVRDEIPSGATRTFSYANDQRPATLWYHDHLLMRTGERVMRGLAGAYLILDPSEADLGLPVGDERDLVLLLTDKSLADDGTLVYDAERHQPFVGDVVLVNGADRPRVEVAADLLRLRMVNASNARPYRLQRADSQPLLQVGTDHGLLDRPREMAQVELWPSERVELLLDLRGQPVGAQVVIGDAFQVGDGGLLRIDVVEGGPSEPAVIPQAFPPLADLTPPEVTRTVTLDEDGGVFLLNGHGYDPDVRDVFARLGAVERWRLVNTTQATHPIHLHLVAFRIVRRTDRQAREMALRPEDAGWKDVVLVRGGEVVEIDARFDDHLGDFMYHCHILEHEDHDMMSQFRVVDLSRIAGRNRVETAAAVAASLRGPRRVAVVASGLDWPGALAGAALADALLLVTGPVLDPAVLDELDARPPDSILVAGGTDQVHPEAERQLVEIAPTTRVDTSEPAALAAGVATALAASADTVVLATAEKFPDALAAGTLGVPLLLTDPHELSAPTAAALDSLGAGTVLIAGGVAAISQRVADTVTATGRRVERIAGPDRFATAVAFARRAGVSSTVVAASAGRFPDALAAGLAARDGGMLILLGDGALDPATSSLLDEARPTSAVVVGGEAAVGLPAEAALAARLGT